MNERADRVRDAVRAAGMENTVVTVSMEPEKFAIIVDANGVGRKGSMMVRCVQFLPFNYSDAELQYAVDAITREVRRAVEGSGLIGVKF